MESMVTAVFDHGHYQQVSAVGIDGQERLSRALPIKIHAVPAWFVDAVGLNPPSMQARLIFGWQQGGVVPVTSHPGHAYRELYAILVDTLLGSLGSFVVVLIFTTAILRLILRSLRAVENQALAVAEREFPLVQDLPRTRKLRSVAQAMNRMVLKVQQMLQEQYLRAEWLREAAYVDEITGIANQRSFDAHMQQLLAPDADLAFGGLVLVSVGGLDEVNHDFGYEVGGGLLRAVARAVDGVIDTKNSICTRLGGALLESCCRALRGPTVMKHCNVWLMSCALSMLTLPAYLPPPRGCLLRCRQSA